MKNAQDHNWSRRSLVNVLAVVIFTSLMAVAIGYFYQAQPNVREARLSALAQQFSASVTNAHWQWQAEGRPSLIMLVHYERGMDDNQQLVEKDRRPIRMASHGWPQVATTSEGCGKLWRMVLNLPLEINGFRVYAEYFKGENQRPAKCRFRLSTGAYFEYNTQNGAVSNIIS